MTIEEVTIPNETPPVETPTMPEFSTIIPEGYADKPWVKDTKDVGSFFKQFDDLKTQMGQRPGGIPQETASDEEKAKFYSELGVPGKAEEYELSGNPGGVKNEDFEKGIRDLFHKANMTKTQATDIEKGFNELVSKFSESQGLQSQQTDEEFNVMSDKVFGEDKEQALKVAHYLLQKHNPAEMHDSVNKLTNEQLMPVAMALYNIQKEYIGEDNLPDNFGGGSPSGPEANIAKGKELMDSAAYKDPFHVNHEATRIQVDKLFGTHVE